MSPERLTRSHHSFGWLNDGAPISQWYVMNDAAMMLSSGPFWCVELPSQGDPPWDMCREGEPLASEHCAKHLGRVTKE